MGAGALLRDLRGGLRLLVARPGFTIVAVLSLALGIGVNTTVFTLASTVFLQAVPVRDPARAVTLFTRDARNPTLGYLATSYINLRDYQQKTSVFSGMAIVVFSGATWLNQGRAQTLGAELVNANFFSVLGERISPGRDFLPEEDSAPGAHPVAIVSHDLWVKQFGADPAVIGRSINLNGLDFTVIGVTPPEFQNLGGLGGAQVFVPMAMYGQILTGLTRQWFLERRPAFAGAVARLQPGVTLRQAQLAVSALATQLARQYPTDDGGRDMQLVPLSESNVGPNARPMFLLAATVMFVIATLVLLIACANVANLLLARATQRRRELAIRLALGAGRARLVRQLLTESLLLALLSAVVAMAFAWFAKDALWALRPPGFNRPLHLSWMVLLFTLAMAVGAAVLFGLVPALQATRPSQMNSLRDRTEPATGSRHWYSLRGLLVAAQVAFSLVALIVAGLFIHSLINAQQVNLGFDAAHLVVVSPDLKAAGYPQARADQFYRDAVQRLQSLPQVAAAGITDARPLFGGLERTTFAGGVDTSDNRNGKLTPVIAVRPGYFRTMGIALLRGRDFSDSDGPGSAMVAVVNQALADRLWPGQDPLGKHLSFLQEPWDITVVGEVPTVKFATLGESPQAQVYTSFEQMWAPAVILVRTVGPPSRALANIRATVANLDRSLPPPPAALVTDRITRMLDGPTLGAELLAVFGLLALLLAAVGTYGVMAYSVSQRVREIGVRMALGASRGQVLQLIVGSGMAMVLAGLVLGLLLAALLARGAGALLYGVGGLDGPSFAAAAVALLLAALIACWLPARRALAIDPNLALRED